LAKGLEDVHIVELKDMQGRYLPTIKTQITAVSNIATIHEKIVYI
jgi:hypothetical protein